jgi:large subunit ribosomal protein L24
LQVQAIGHGPFSFEQGARIAGTLQVAVADLRPLRPAGAVAANEALPFSLMTRVSIAGRSVGFDDIDAKLGQSIVRGRLALGGTSPRRIDGALETSTLDAAALVARAVDMPAAGSAAAGWRWSSEPFGAGIFGDYAGGITLKSRQVDLLPGLAAREFRATLHFGRQEFALDDIAANIAGGHLAGSMSFRTAEDGLNARAKFSLDGADAAALLPSGARPPVAGQLGLTSEVAGSGLSPVALIGSLQGSGKFTLSDAQFAGLDPHAFDAVTRAVDQGLAVDAGRITELVSRALDSGQLSVKHAAGNLAVSAGQVRVSNVTAESKDAKLSLAGTVDLTDGTIDARLLLSGKSEATGSRPDIFMALKGPVSAPTRSIDVSALTGWLTMRAVENQAKQLRAIEGATPQPKEKAPQPRGQIAPALPPPVDIKPAPGRAAPPEASVGPQN